MGEVEDRLVYAVGFTDWCYRAFFVYDPFKKVFLSIVLKFMIDDVPSRSDIISGFFLGDSSLAYVLYFLLIA